FVGFDCRSICRREFCFSHWRRSCGMCFLSNLYLGPFQKLNASITFGQSYFYKPHGISMNVLPDYLTGFIAGWLAFSFVFPIWFVNCFGVRQKTPVASDAMKSAAIRQSEHTTVGVVDGHLPQRFQVFNQ